MLPLFSTDAEKPVCNAVCQLTDLTFSCTIAPNTNPCDPIPIPIQNMRTFALLYLDSSHVTHCQMIGSRNSHFQSFDIGSWSRRKEICFDLFVSKSLIFKLRIVLQKSIGKTVKISYNHNQESIPLYQNWRKTWTLSTAASPLLDISAATKRRRATS